jgi:hypothetical protein
MTNHDGAGIPTYPEVVKREKGMGPGAGGQSGDTQGLPENAEADSESVAELVEEGQYSEADAIDAIEGADEVAEVHTRQIPEDDVPLEYRHSD